MTQALPTLALRKSKQLLLLNVSSSISEFIAPLAHYRIEEFRGANAHHKLLKLLSAAETSEIPYAIICDYETLSKNNFAYVQAFRKNILTSNIPIIAVAKTGESISPNALRNGIDDCYVHPIVNREICERIEFLRKYKAEMLDLNVNETDTLKVRMSPFKRFLDVSIATTCICMASPILLLTAALISLESKGPVIYRSERSGTGYKIFNFLKFRSMYADADQKLNEIQHLNQYAEKDAAFLKVKNDPRITRVGRFIRKTSIDELPQLFNVLKGDMSIVGNRPLPLYEAEKLTKEDWAYRFIAPAGITGLWQVSKRGQDDMSAEERIGLDVDYAKNNSFWFDLKLLLKTPFAIIQKENV